MKSGPGPIEDSYWAGTHVLAGPLPTAPDRAASRTRIRSLLDAGVRTVIDLRTPMESPSARSLLGKLSDEADACAWLGAPILDGAAPSDALLSTILDAIDASVARERTVYVHCQGGLGRTGTVVACWWIRHAVHEPEAALEALATARVGLASAARPSPETGAQLRLVRSWTAGR